MKTHRSSVSSGIALVELAILLPVLLLIIAAIVGIGNALIQRQWLDQVAYLAAYNAATVSTDSGRQLSSERWISTYEGVRSSTSYKGMASSLTSTSSTVTLSPSSSRIFNIEVNGTTSNLLFGSYSIPIKSTLSGPVLVPEVSTYQHLNFQNNGESSYDCCGQQGNAGNSCVQANGAYASCASSQFGFYPTPVVR